MNSVLLHMQSQISPVALLHCLPNLSDSFLHQNWVSSLKKQYSMEKYIFSRPADWFDVITAGGNRAIPIQSFASLLAKNRAANFCQLWEILRYEYLSVGMGNENNIEKNTRIILWQFVKYKTEEKSSHLIEAGTVKVASFLSLIFNILLTEFITSNSFMAVSITWCLCVIESYIKMCSWSVGLYWAILSLYTSITLLLCVQCPQNIFNK